MHDTLKKPRELLAVAYGLRNPELAARSKHPSGEVDLDTMDPQVGHMVSLSSINESDPRMLACGARQTATPYHRKVDVGNHLLQFHLPTSLPVYHQDWTSAERLVSIISLKPVTNSTFSIQKAHQIRME